MQNTLLDILILGLLVLLFGSIYRTRRTLQLRYWIAGWLFILAHFALQLPNPVTVFWSNMLGALGVAGLLLGGFCFLVASSTDCIDEGPKASKQALLAIPAVLFVFAVAFGITHAYLLLPLFILLEAAATCFVLCCWRKTSIIVISSLAAAAAILWAGHDILTHQDFPGVYPILMQVYLLNAVVFWHGFQRRSMGVITSVVGLVAWGLVFPCAAAMAIFWPHLQVSAELWNLPKYFVEFGMILTLMEGEVIDTALQREEYRVLFDGNPHPMWIFDPETLRFLKVNEAAIAHYGYSEDEFMAKNLREIRPPEDIPKLEHRLQDAGPNTLHSGPWTHLRKDGSSMQVEVDSHAIMFEGKLARFSLVQDVTERQQLYDKLVHQAHHDTLTGLPNRLLLKDRMEQMLVAAERFGHEAAIVCMDLDRFKQVNDTYGHHAGDICLQQISANLRDKLRMTDTIARSGGEEFIVLLGQLKSPADAGYVAQVLLDSFRQSLMIEGNTINLTASIGIAMYPADGKSAQLLWRLADSAMYRAKRAGGNRYIFVASDTLVPRYGDTEYGMNRVLDDRSFEDLMPGD
jgi:diguanylate cyclase (GGDEF)-like protein/PAS domain S-box-containing protein